MLRFSSTISLGHLLSGCLSQLLTESQHCDPVGSYSVRSFCSNGVYALGPFDQLHEIVSRGDAVYDLTATLSSEPASMTIRVLPMPGKQRVYTGGASSLSYYTSSATLPPFVSVTLTFDSNCDYWMELIGQRPGMGLGFSSDDSSESLVYACHAQAFRETSAVLQKEVIRPFRPSFDPVGTFIAQVTCFSGDVHVADFTETQVISQIEGTIGFFSLQHQRDSDSFFMLDIISQNGYKSTSFTGATRNISNYNVDPSQSAYSNDEMVPLIESFIEFSSTDAYSGVLIGQRPALTAEQPYPVYACNFNAVKEGSSAMSGSSDSLACDPVGKYRAFLTCKSGEDLTTPYREEMEVTSLSNGFLQISFAHVFDNFKMESILAPHPSSSNTYIGASYSRTDNSDQIRGYNTTLYPLYHIYASSFFGDDTCDEYTSILIAYNVALSGTDENMPFHVCRLSARRIPFQ